MSRGVIYKYAGESDEIPLLKLWAICYSDIYNVKNYSHLSFYIPIEYNDFGDPENSLIFTKEQIEDCIIALNKMQLYCELEQELEIISHSDETYHCYVIDVDCQRTTRTGIKLLMNAVRYLFENYCDQEHNQIVTQFLNLCSINIEDDIHNLFLLAHNLTSVTPTGHSIVTYYNDLKSMPLKKYTKFLNSNHAVIDKQLPIVPKLTDEFKQLPIEEQIKQYKIL